MRVSLSLDVTAGEGFLAPYLDGLRRGEAIAGRCTACGRTALPPEPRCRCGAAAAEMRRLAGTATVLWRTTGTDGDAALVRFDGADTLSVARLETVGGATRVRIAASDAAALVVTAEPSP
ncbi:MAG: hypothetical protein MUC84_11420 [Solirubrobacteraceae bacterium]|nr:hypothetical protein [Solirubrobacteraceae bacterium]